MSEILGFLKKDSKSFVGFYNRETNHLEKSPHFEISKDKCKPAVFVEDLENLVKQIESDLSVQQCSKFGSAGAGIMKSSIISLLKKRLKEAKK